MEIIVLVVVLIYLTLKTPETDYAYKDWHSRYYWNVRLEWFSIFFGVLTLMLIAGNSDPEMIQASGGLQIFTFVTLVLRRLPSIEKRS